MFNNGIMNADVAIEIIAEMIADNLLALQNAKDERLISKINKKVLQLKYFFCLFSTYYGVISLV